MVLWVVIIIVPYIRVRSHFLWALVIFLVFFRGPWKLLKRGLGGEDLLQSIFSQSLSHTVCRRGLEESGRVESEETED